MSDRLTLVKSTKGTELVGYDIMLDGVLVGRVMRVMMTREQRTPGKRYVNRRWQSPGWTFTLGSSFSGGWEQSTRGEAIGRVLDGHVLRIEVDAMVKTVRGVR